MSDDAVLRVDSTTLLLSISLLAFLAAGLSLSSSRRAGEDSHGLVEWSIALACSGAAFLLYFFRGHGPAALTFLLANVLALAAATFTHLAHARFFGVPAPRATIRLLWIAGFGGVVAHHFFDISIDVAVVSLSCSIATLSAMNAALILRDREWRAATTGRIAAASMLVISATVAARALLTLAGGGSSVALHAQTFPQGAALVVGSVAILGASIGFVIMVHDRQRHEILESARRDGLTGLLTRTALLEALDEFDADSTGTYSIVMLDIDHFKDINDSVGHVQGDIVLAHAARLIQQSVRSQDIASRYGGEEFCIALRDCGPHEAHRFAERLVAEADRQRVRLPGGISMRFTFSAGCGSRTPASGVGAPAESAALTLERADRALYEAKRAGRNRAVASSAAADSEASSALPQYATAARSWADSGAA